jgi:hypothetical protein
MGSFFDKNLDLLRRSNQFLSSTIAELGDDPSIVVVEAKDNNKVPEVSIGKRRVYIHSRFAPEREAERLISEVDAGQYDLFIVFGFGFGYHIEELLKKIRRDSTVLALEKSAHLLKEAMKHRDLSDIFGDERFKILAEPNDEDIADVLKGKSSYRVAFITHRGSFQTHPEYYSNLSRIAKSYISTKEVNIATLAKFEKTWSANIARNIQQIISCPGVNVFFNGFENIPAIVVAAGPSLNQSLDFIRRNAVRSIIISVDTSYKILMNNGIEPHFCVSVDPQVVNARYFEGDIEGRTIMVADPTIHPSVFRLYKGKKVLTGMVFQMMKWINDVTGEKGELAYGGSVSTNAYDFAKMIGASPIILIGQDLAFSGGYAHARGSYLDEQVHLRTDRFYNAEIFNRNQLSALPKIYVRGIKAKRVQTNQKMMIFLSWFEKRHDPSLINATCDGVYIPGVEHCSFESIRLHELSEDLFTKMLNMFHDNLIREDERESMRRTLLNRVTGMYGELEGLLPALKRAVKFSEELISQVNGKKRNQERLDYLLGKLSETDRIIESKNTLKDMIGFTIQRVIHTITEGYNIDGDDSSLPEEARIAKRSGFLYRGLLEGTLFNRKILKKVINLLER